MLSKYMFTRIQQREPLVISAMDYKIVDACNLSMSLCNSSSAVYLKDRWLESVDYQAFILNALK